MQQCPKCGKQYPPNAVMCPKCKIPFSQQQPNAQYQQQLNVQYQQQPTVVKRKLAWWQVMLIVVGAIIVVPIAMVVIAGLGSDSKYVSKSVASQDNTPSSKAGTPSSKESTPAAPSTSATAGLGEALEHNGLKITLTSAINYVDTSDYPMDKPGEGMKFVVLNFMAENTGEEKEHVNMFYEESYCDDTAIDPEIMMIGVEGETFWGDVASGKKRVGYVCYEVPTDWTKLEFYYSPELSSNHQMKFEVSADQVK